jgi:hypothetical protein
MKTSIELISSLDRHGKAHDSALLIVGFPALTRAVPDRFSDRLQLLEDLLQQGGIPVGILSVDAMQGETSCLCCVLEDRVADEWAEPYMVALAEKLLTAGLWKPLTQSIGIDDFRTRR